MSRTGDFDPLKIVAQSLAPQLRSLGKGAFLSRALRRAERAETPRPRKPDMERLPWVFEGARRPAPCGTSCADSAERHDRGPRKVFL
jgi:hypothetical protein